MLSIVLLLGTSIGGVRWGEVQREEALDSEILRHGSRHALALAIPPVAGGGEACHGDAGATPAVASIQVTIELSE